MFVWFYLVLKKSALRQTPLGMSDTGIAHGCCHLVPPAASRKAEGKTHPFRGRSWGKRKKICAHLKKIVEKFGRFVFFQYFCTQQTINNSFLKLLLPIRKNLLHNKYI